jgi:hypothetical protein
MSERMGMNERSAEPLIPRTMRTGASTREQKSAGEGVEIHCCQLEESA